MIKVLLSPEAETRFKKYSPTTKKRFIHSFRSLGRRKFSTLKRLPYSNLLVKNVGDYRLILSMEPTSVIVVDILTKKKLAAELRKSNLYY